MPEFKKIADRIKEYLPFLPLALFCVYVAGFTIWNRFLTNFRLFEFNFLQTQFISAGILAVVIFLPYVFLCMYILRWRYFRYALFSAGAFFYWFYIFPFIIFPLIPQSFGGGLPIITSLTGTSTQIKFLEDGFQIPSEPNAEGKKDPVQTKPLCLFFARGDRSIVGPIMGNVGRVVSLPDDQFIGFSQPKGGYTAYSKFLFNYPLPCFQYLKPYSHVVSCEIANDGTGKCAISR